MLYGAERRADRRGTPFDLDLSDIQIPARCPIDGEPIVRGDGVATNRSPSLDCLDPALGYVKGNVSVISLLWNRRKDDMTPDDLRLLLRYMTRQSESFPEHCVLAFGG
jgi:hypothetical protein